MPIQGVTSVAGPSDMSIAESLYQVKLLSALRSGDPALIHPLLAEITNSKRKSFEDGANVDIAAAALHLAIRCASLDTVRLLLSHRSISPNAVYPPSSGTTPLHLSAALGRIDVVNLLLEQDSINDTLRDSEGRTVRDVARGREVQKVIRDSRALLTANFRSLLHHYISSDLNTPPPEDLLTLLSSPRVRLIDLSYLESTSGRSLLHEAARRKDLRLIELGVRAGADVFVRDSKGRGVAQSIKDEKVKVFLRQFTNQDTTLLDSPDHSNLSEPPTLRGYLNKYTNVAKGYAARWFVLKNGVLSYYRHQEDENVASRGAISMKSATLRRSGTDKLRFEITAVTHGKANSSTALGYLGYGASSGTATPGGTSGHPQQKWYIKGNHVAEVNRWCVTLERAIEFAQRGSKIQRDVSGQGSPAISAPPSQHGHGKDSESEKESRSLKSLAMGIVQAHGHRFHHSGGEGSKASSLYGYGDGTGEDTATQGAATASSLYEGGRQKNGGASVVGDLSAPDANSELNGDGVDEGDLDNDDSSDDRSVRVPPHEGAFAMQGNTLVAQIELAAQLAARFPAAIQQHAPAMSSASSSTSSSSASVNMNAISTGTATPSSTHLQTIHAALLDSITSTQRLVDEYVTMARERDDWWREKLKKERERGEVWEESLRVVVREGEELERELRARLRGANTGAGAGVGSDATEEGKIKDREMGYGSLKATPTPSRMTGSVRRTPSLALSAPLSEFGFIHGSKKEPSGTGLPSVVESSGGTVGLASRTKQVPVPGAINTEISTIKSSSRLLSPTLGGVEIDDSVVDTDEEDEFFDAIDANALPNVIIPDALVSGATPAQPIDVEHLHDVPCGYDAMQYEGYANLRTRLPIEKDTRPPTSLWSVLKHSIGKDLTKISFPVFFNEPTSMLQRMAEDMEFSECLDAATAEPDPHRRIAFVAAFAMSNYSSTIGRIAKPFNPMLSETFEYVRLDKKYRYVSEQVSHHPPISACWAESPSWHYFGEVDAQNKFMGKSFEIRPTGIAHAELMIPEDLAPHYPKAKGPKREKKVVEHYSWKKVTTNVSGFILGSPTIDHYGDMTVVNHRTGDVCVLTFKPRGWRGKDAFEIFGNVMDASGNVTYEIAGRWNSQLVARAVGTGFGVLHPDVSVGSPPNSPSTSASSTEFVLLWRNTPKPSTPFNLTPFAITLNDNPDNLRKYLCPTDCRLRPDQRAFEIGKYERANELKQKQEELQRATRRAREEGTKPKHRPRWFVARTEVDTGERVWEPIRHGEDVAYWKERERTWKEGAPWEDVDQIFIDDEP